MRHLSSDQVREIVQKNSALGVRSDFSGKNLFAVSFEGMRLEDAMFVGSYMRNCNFKDCLFFGCDFTESNLSDSSLVEATFIECVFDGSSMQRVVATGADFRDSSFVGTSLKDSDLKSSLLDGAKFRDSDLSGSDLSFSMRGSAEFTRCVGLRLDDDNLWPHQSYGHKTSAVIKARKSIGMPQAYMARHFPSEFGKVKGITKGRAISESVFANVESSCATLDRSKKPLVWLLSRQKYSGSQIIFGTSNEVVLFNVYIPSFSKEETETLRRLADVSRRSGHPQESGELFTVGWVRYVNLDKSILIEEVQSDVDSAIKGIRSSSNPENERMLKMLEPFLPYSEAFYYDAVGTIFQLADLEGKSVTMLSHEQKAKFGSPRSVYEDLPRKMGMRPVASSVPGVQGKVWTYTPNRRRR